MAKELNKKKSTTLHLSRGRPRKQPATLKTRYLGFRLPEEEIKAIEAAAAAVGESVSEYVRKAIENRMAGPKPAIPSASISYEIPPVKVMDTKSSSSDSKSIVIRFHLTEDEHSQKET